MRLIVGMTGATGAVFGVRLLELLAELPGVETHLVLSRWARTTVELETGRSAREVAALADVLHGPEDQGATISSGSFRTDGMVIAPCSMKTLKPASGRVTRTAWWRAPPMWCSRNTAGFGAGAPGDSAQRDPSGEHARAGPDGRPHRAADARFYNHPATVEDIVDHLVARVLDQFELPAPAARRWAGLRSAHRNGQAAATR